jgi:hypothetical protein
MNRKGNNLHLLVNWLIKALLITGFICFEAFNVMTTSKSVNLIMRASDIGILLAVAIAFTDIGGLSRILTPQIGKEEPAMIKVITAVWLIVAVANAGMTWYYLQVNIEQDAPVVPAVLAGSTGIIAVVLALTVLMVHVTMIYALSIWLDVLHNGQRVGAPLTQAAQVGKHAQPHTSIVRPPEKVYRPMQPQMEIPEMRRINQTESQRDRPWQSEK